MKEGDNPLADYLNDYIDLEVDSAAEQSATEPSYRGQLTAKAIYLYELSEHPDPWNSRDDEDLVQRK